MDVTQILADAPHFVAAIERLHEENSRFGLIHNDPPTLWHYTSSAALHSICSTGVLRATEARFMNDASELEYSLHVLREALEQAVFSTTEAQEAATQALRRIEQDEFGWMAFLTCFCESSDLLSQWRGYGKDVVPVALGFNMIGPPLSAEFQPRVRLRKVTYARDQQISLVLNSLSVWEEAWQQVAAAEGHPTNGELFVLSVQALEVIYEDLLSSFKHYAFKEEQEWRLVCMLYDVADEQAELISYVSSHYGLRPYIDLPVQEDQELAPGHSVKRLPLREVKVGPTLHQALALRSTHGFLSSVDLFGVNVRASRIPLR